MKITAAQMDDPYSDLIVTMFASEFPGSACSEKMLLNILSQEVIGTKQHRYGPLPDAETEVSIRQVIKANVEAGLPIQILVPWGGSKQGPFGIDVAEVMALKQLHCLYTRIKAHYNAGVRFQIRLEDATDRVLFGPGTDEKTFVYCDMLDKLILNLEYDHFIFPRWESREMDLDKFLARAEQNSQSILMAMNTSLPDLKEEQLLKIGWVGHLPLEQIDYYRRAYERFYPDKSSLEREKMIANYFGASLARKQLNGTAAPPHPFLTLGFSPPVVGASTERRIFYRTMPERFTNQHRAPWIAKGYVRVKGRQVTPALAGWTGDNQIYNLFAVRIGNLEIESDYVVLE